MNLLFLYKYLDTYDFDHWLHMSWVEYLAKLNYCGIKSYGPWINEGYPKTCLVPYDAKLRLSDLKQIYDFHAIIVMTKSRCFFHYNPKKDQADGCWLPPDFKDWNKTPKVILEEDSHYEKDGTWEQSMKFDLILQRHYSQSVRGGDGTKFWGVPCKWHPFSIDTTIFDPNRLTIDYKDQQFRMPPGTMREKKIAFVGNYADEAYKYRRDACKILNQYNMVADYCGARKVNIDYVKILRQYVSYISCGSTVEITAAKNLEIMASGGILFTNKFLGIDEMFPPDCYVPYKNDGSDVASQGFKVLNDTAYQNKVLQNAFTCIRQRHTHEIRLKELMNILKGLGAPN